MAVTDKLTTFSRPIASATSGATLDLSLLSSDGSPSKFPMPISIGQDRKLLLHPAATANRTRLEPTCLPALG
ncbi:Hypothetical protein NTJ_16156 [Nesidiocoris tenuis]|uniref:Uncharacterized protein n=1 Tax=Nesidiocoris tenuis TaxID=355587 RepID=A0ABN7BHJ7_9HEMI|nr:Hypothetical protein NTJ_16156 [Nesidiocoris tenuis]